MSEKGKILLVDDDPEVLSARSRPLKVAGMKFWKLQAEGKSSIGLVKIWRAP